jgi:hypothetical protein
VEDRGRIPAGLRSAWATEAAGGVATDELEREAQPRTEPEREWDGFGPQDVREPEPDQPEPEQPRQELPPGRPPGRAAGLRDRLRDRAAPRDRGGRRRYRRRSSLETIGGLAWGGIARLAAAPASGQYLPVAKMMSFQAPVAGLLIEDSLKNTVADRALQPVARMVESGSALGTLVGMNLLVAACCRKPELYPQARPAMISLMRQYVIDAGPRLREMRKREEKFAEEMGQFQAEFGVGIEQLLDEVFNVPRPAAPAQPPAGGAQANGHPGAAA